jgi:hypothetical protein
MKAGRPKGITKYKKPKPFTAGRHQQRLDALLAKKQKLEMLEALIQTHEKTPNPDFELIRNMKRRANDVRSQFRVLSTVSQDEQEELISQWR